MTSIWLKLNLSRVLTAGIVNRLANLSYRVGRNIRVSKSRFNAFVIASVPKTIKTGFYTTGLSSPLLAIQLMSKKLTEKEKIMQQADQLFDNNEFDKLLTLLKSQPSWYDDSDFLWRVARCEFQLYKTNPENESLINDAYLHVVKSIELNNECGPAHKWAAILLEAISSKKGTRAKVEQLFNIKDHMEKAVKYSPEDPTARFILGTFHYETAQVSWIEKKLAAALFGSLPEPDLEEALRALEKAEELEPGFYSKNQVQIAKVLIALKRDKEKTQSILLKVIEQYKTSTKWDDAEAVKDATKLLSDMGIKVEQ